MRVLYALPCEEVFTHPDGRVDFRGVFHRLYARVFPAHQDRLAFAVGIEWDREEPGRQGFRIDLLDPTRTPILTMSGHTDVLARVAGAAPPRTELVLDPPQGVRFQKPGTYLFQLVLGDVESTLAPLHLIEDPDA